LSAEIVEKLRAAAKAVELQRQCSGITELEKGLQNRVLDLITAGRTRASISLPKFLEVLHELERTDEQPEESLSRVPSDMPRGPFSLDLKIDDISCLPIVFPLLTMQMFLQCPRNPEGEVEVKALFNKFGQAMSLAKMEAELHMFDADNDGRITEEETELYVQDLIPTIGGLAKMEKDFIPFYCCAASRRIFWTLDSGGRGSVRIADLLRSSIMDEWLELQLTSDELPRNWFGVSMSTQLYDKFLALDSREVGTLCASDMKKYKKGIPMIAEDGLPPGVSPLSSLFIDRVFETLALYSSEMDYKKFVDFVIAVEFLPQCHRPAFFWNIFDMNGDGVLTPLTVNHFFKETHRKLQAAGVEAPAAELVVQELFDVIPTREPLRITRAEFCASNQAGLFSALLIDCLAFWTYENREQR
jgi:serine/threonine-protein phosphatase 2A regulatory subunit B''